MKGIILAFWFIGGSIIGMIIGWARESLKKVSIKESPLLVVGSDGTVSIPHSNNEGIVHNSSTHPAVKEILKKAKEAGL